MRDRDRLDLVLPERAPHDEGLLTSDGVTREDDPVLRDRDLVEAVTALRRAARHLRDDPPPCSRVGDHAFGRTRLLAPGHHVAARRDRCHEVVRQHTRVGPAVRGPHHGRRVAGRPHEEHEARRGGETEERVDRARKRPRRRRSRGCGRGWRANSVSASSGPLSQTRFRESAATGPDGRMVGDHERAGGQARRRCAGRGRPRPTWRSLSPPALRTGMILRRNADATTTNARASPAGTSRRNAATHLTLGLRRPTVSP